MIKTTKEQRKALFKLFQRDFPTWVAPTRRHERACCPNCGYGGAVVKVPSIQYRKFRKQVCPVFGGDGAVIIPWQGMWVGIESDGYTHT